MGNPLFWRPIDGVHRHLDDGNSRPYCPNQNLHLKLVSPTFCPKVEGLREGINPKSGLRIGEPSPA
jgi:hypothetical protein